MSINFSFKSGNCANTNVNNCPTKDGCPTDGTCPDFMIKRHDTKPVLRVSIEDCNGPIDFRANIIEVNMWALAKLKAAIDDTIDYFRLADDVGFEQVMVGDVIIMDRARLPEHMLVLGFDEENKLIQVQRGYHGTTPSSWKKGSTMRIFRIMNGIAESELIFEDITDVDGTVENDVLTESVLIYEWQAQDTCLPGCFWLEFKVLKMQDVVWFLPGGSWVGEVHQEDDGYFYTGTTQTDSSVKISYHQVGEIYLLPSTPWTGEIHMHTDDNFYTGSSHDDGSVYLDKSGIPVDSDISFDDNGMALVDTSIIPSFTSSSLTPEDFGCSLSDGVESVRRYPLTGEGFLIKIVNSVTGE